MIIRLIMRWQSMFSFPVVPFRNLHLAEFPGAEVKACDCSCPKYLNMDPPCGLPKGGSVQKKRGALGL